MLVWISGLILRASLLLIVILVDLGFWVLLLVFVVDFAGNLGWVAWLVVYAMRNLGFGC